MGKFTTTLLDGADRLSSQFRPLNALVERVVERIAPRVTVAACHGSNVYCGSWCDIDSSCPTGDRFWVTYASTQARCDGTTLKCSQCRC